MRFPQAALFRFAAITLLLAPALLSAQTRSNPQLREVEPGDRAHYWLTFGLGVGSESGRVPATGNGYAPSLEKPTLSLRVGGTVSQNLRLGGELFGWFNQEGDLLESLTSLLLIGQFYPARRAGFFVKGGAGLGRYGLDWGDGSSRSDLGFAASIGTGYELRVHRNLYLVPTVDLVQHAFSGRSYQTYHERVVNFGLSIGVQGR